MSVQRERSQRMDVLTTLLIGLMALFGEVPQPEVDRVCEEREVALERALEGWEREIIKAHLANDRLKAATPEERLSIPDYEKVIYFRLGSVSSKLDLFLKKVSRDAGVRLCNLKRRAGFDASILPPKRAALSGAERVSKVNNVANWRCFPTSFHRQVRTWNGSPVVYQILFLYLYICIFL